MQRKRTNDLRIATWNIRTMLAPGRMEEIGRELIKHKYDITAIQETRWKGQGEIKKKEYTVYYSGTENRTGQKGTGFIITGKTRESILGFEPVNERICKIRIKGRFRNITLICVYAPTEDAASEEKESFYEEVNNTLRRIPRYDLTILLGDLNAKIGKEDFIRPVSGLYSLHEETNDNGSLLGQLAAANKMIIKSTCFKH